MKIEFEISDSKLQNLSVTAKDEVKKVSRAYMEDVLDEASRIEESRRINNSSPEVTAAIINDAVYFAKSFGIRRKKPKKQFLLQIVAFVSSTITGGLFDVDKFNDIVYVTFFLMIFLMAVVSTVYLMFNENAND